MSNTVLIVDDSLTVRMDLQEAFDGAGFKSKGCATLAAARDVLDREPMDVIVLDVRLPDGDGVDLLQEIRASDRHAQAVVLMLSGESDVKDRLRGLRTGADEYVGKPYDTSYVLAKANELVRARRNAGGVGRVSILVIDDSVTFREGLRELFEGAGFHVQTAASGEEGLKAAAASRPGAIVVDSVMGGIDGATVIRRVRLDASLRGIPCLLLTGSEEIGAELRALEAGADAFVRKSEDPGFILAKLTATLRSAAGSLAGDGASATQGTRRILAVDDSPTFLGELSAMLLEEGYDVVQAHSGEEALELLAVQSVDCILLDLMMPGLGGQETCKRIKSAPVVRDIPLIMLTAQDDEATMMEGLSAGADDYLRKSSEMDVLKARVRAQIRRKQFEDENRRMRMELLKAELEAAEARSARALADSRAELLSILEQKNEDLENANKALQKQTEELANAYAELTSANQAKSDFLSTMSHELRTPLNAIIGFSYIMMDGIGGVLNQQQREYVSHIHEGGQHLLALVNDILDLSKIEAGKVDIDLEPIHLDSLLSDALSVVQEKASARGINLVCLGLRSRGEFKADRRRVKQIIYNLLSNAVKFTPDRGQVTMQAQLVDRQTAASSLPGFGQGVRMNLPDNEHQTFVQISVMDSGIGIAQADMDKLFKPFMQIKNELTKKVEGTGLGLTTVLRLAQLHGGTVALTSEAGKGCCFTVWLPWRATQAEVPVTQAPAGQLALVIEDDEQAASLMCIQLKSAGFQVRHVTSAESALALVQELTPDLITLDIMLPGMDGWEFLTRVKELPSWADVPVVVVSIAGNHEVGLSLGATAILPKPFGPSELMQELNRLGFKPSPAHDVTVVVVDDDPRAVELMSVYLQQPGYQVIKAYGGQEGIDMIQSKLPDLVVLDLLMPDIGGIEVVEVLKRDPATAEIPVIMVTAKQFSETDRNQLNSHVLSVVNKANLHENRFLNEVRRACRQSASIASLE